jgi:uncharacterized protein YcaQ
VSVTELTNDTARRLFLQRHALLEPPAGPAKGAALADLIERLGFVQVDSVNTLARAHDLILWSRRPTYRPASLRWINDRARATFEHWTHDASIIPMAFHQHWRLRFARDRDRLHGRWKDWHGDRFHGELDRVLAHVSDNGPVSSGDFAGERAEKSTGWWDWHPSKTALEYLWRSGDLAVTRREGFRKLYDLSERVVPPEVLNARTPDVAETVDWACSAALDRLGFATSGELAAFWDLVTPSEAKDWVVEARASGRVIDVAVACVDGSLRRSVAWPGTVEEAAGAGGPRAADARPQPLRPGTERPQAGGAPFRLPLPHRDLRAGGAAALRLLRLPGAGGDAAGGPDRHGRRDRADLPDGARLLARGGCAHGIGPQPEVVRRDRTRRAAGRLRGRGVRTRLAQGFSLGFRVVLHRWTGGTPVAFRGGYPRIGM